MPLDYRSVEGRLHGLGQRPEGRPASSNLATGSSSRPAPGPRGAFHETVDRIDLDIAVRNGLDRVDRLVIREHYVLGIKRHSYRARSRAVRHLVSFLDSQARKPDD